MRSKTLIFDSNNNQFVCCCGTFAGLGRAQLCFVVPIASRALHRGSVADAKFVGFSTIQFDPECITTMSGYIRSDCEHVPGDVQHQRESRSDKVVRRTGATCATGFARRTFCGQRSVSLDNGYARNSSNGCATERTSTPRSNLYAGGKTLVREAVHAAAENTSTFATITGHAPMMAP
jgi:hypothetical protein